MPMQSLNRRASGNGCLSDMYLYSQNGLGAEAATLGEALLTGMILGIYYDIFRIIRRIIRFGYANIVGQDVFFWTTSAIFTFFVTIRLNYGVVRIYFVAAVLGGWLLYLTTVGVVTMAVADALVRFGRGMVLRLHNIGQSAREKAAKKRELKQKKKKEGQIYNKLKNTLEK